MKIRFAFILAFLAACSPKPPTDTIVTIATAANAQFAIDELVKTFTSQTGIPCDVVYGSSGKLTAQIREGAPFDVFVSADMEYPNELFKNNLTLDTPRVYGFGSLVLWSTQPDIHPSLALLSNGRISHIALANPKSAPYGQAAVEVLTKNHLYDSIVGKLVYGESIAQTNQFILSGAAEIGFTAKSVVVAPGMSGKGSWIELDPKSYSPIAQGIVLIHHEQSNTNASKFYNFIFSETGQHILEQFGYQLPTNP